MTQYTPSFPVFARFGPVYDQAAMNELVRSLGQLCVILTANGPVQTSSLILSKYPTSATGLRSGTIWVDTANGYVLKVVP